MIVPLDLLAIAKAQAWRKVWIGVGLVLVLGVVGLVTGFIVFFAIAIVISGMISFCSVLLSVVEPTRRLDNLAPDAAFRYQHLRAAEMELSHPARSELRTTKGVALMEPGWFVYHDAATLLVTRRDDVLWFFLTKKRRSKTENLKLHLRHGRIVEIDILPNDKHLLRGLSHALPFAFQGFDARLGAAGRAYLAQEVDRRWYAALG